MGMTLVVTETIVTFKINIYYKVTKKGGRTDDEVNKHCAACKMKNVKKVVQRNIICFKIDLIVKCIEWFMLFR